MYVRVNEAKQLILLFYYVHMKRECDTDGCISTVGHQVIVKWLMVLY